MKCTACGAEIKKDSKFCTSCGKPVEEMKKEETSTAATQPVQTNVEPKKKSNKTLWIVLGIVGGVILLFIILVVVLFALFVGRVRNTIDTIEDYDPIISDITDDEDGKEEKTIKDPSGHKISIVSDEYYGLRVDTKYYYDKEHELIKNAKIISDSEIAKLDGTEKEINATKEAVKTLNSSLPTSRKDIKSSLKNDGYTDEEIEYALKNCGADWKERAIIYAHMFMASGGYSKKYLIHMLEYSEYTTAEAEYAADYKEFNFYEQAAYDVCFYKITMAEDGKNYTKDEVKQRLENDGYTNKEIEFGLKVYDELD